MTAAVLRSPEAKYQLEEVDLDEPSTGEVLVRIVGAGFCHTDVLPRMTDYIAPLPIVTGHEGSGIVEAVGAGVTEVAVGDHVVLSYASCRDCTNCYSGHTAYCQTFLQRNLIGRRVDGSTPIRDSSGAEISGQWFGQSSFATHCVTEAHNVVRVDPELPLELLGPLGCGIQTGAATVLVELNVTVGSSIVVFGVGAVGLSAVMAAHVAGASTIIAVDLNPQRLKMADQLGATHLLDGADPELLAVIHAATSGGAQFSVDTTGLPAVIPSALHSLRLTGSCALIGVQQGEVTLDPTALLGRSVKGVLEGGAVPQVFVPRMIALWQQGRFPFDQMIHTFPLDRINDAERAMTSGEIIKPVLLPQSTTEAIEGRP